MTTPLFVRAPASAPRPPGPRGHPLFGCLPQMKAAPLAYMADCARAFGPVVRLPMPWPVKALVQVSSPELAEHVLVRDAASFSKSRVQRRMVDLLLGEGLFLAEGERWRRSRRIVQPAFQRERLDSYVETFVREADRMVAGWRNGQEIDVHAACADLTLRVAARTFFGAQLAHEVERARAAMDAVNRALDAHLNSLLPLPLSVPTPAGLRLRRATRQLERILARLLRARRASSRQGDDLLSMLLAYRDERGRPLSKRELRDEAITAFIAGTETTALVLGWTFFLLAEHPEAAARVRAEVEAAVGAAGPSVSAARSRAQAPAALLEPRHLRDLVFTRRVALESMRLFPPFWHVARETRKDVVLGGYLIPRGTLVLVMQHLMHRDASVFPEPESFSPDRWTADFLRSLPNLAYSPFGGGQRKCVGDLFAMTELVSVLAQVTRQVELAPGRHKPVPRPTATLRPESGIRLRVLRKHVAPQLAGPPAPQDPPENKHAASASRRPAGP